MRQRIILPIKLYGSSSITLNERLESSASRRTAANPLGIRRSNAQRTPIALRLGQQFNNSSRGRGRPRKVDRRDGISSQTAPVFTPIRRTVPLTSGRGGNFRGGGGGGIRGRSVLTRGRGAPRALAKRRGTRRFNRGAATNPQQMRADLDKELNEYMGGGKRSYSPPHWLIYLKYLNAHYDATVCPAGRKIPPPYAPATPHYTGGYQRKSQRGGVVVLFPVELLAEYEVYART
uniref:Chromatin target of PRMT1 protein C-terminal domain-containing protein n=1 Tax=Echinococcus canadensis TaxID=519352 RepID=A0A915EYB4_9CEST